MNDSFDILRLFLRRCFLGSEGWAFSRSIVLLLRQVEGRYLRRMVRLKRQPDEPLNFYLPRKTRQARQWYAQLGFKFVEERALEALSKFISRTFEAPRDFASEWVFGLMYFKSETS